MGTESPKCNAFALGFSLLIASFFRVIKTQTLFGLRFGPPSATASQQFFTGTRYSIHCLCCGGGGVPVTSFHSYYWHVVPENMLHFCTVKAFTQHYHVLTNREAMLQQYQIGSRKRPVDYGICTIYQYR